MTLRARLTLFFAGIVVLPLVAATVVLQVLVNQEARTRAEERLAASAHAAAALWQERVDGAAREVRHAATALAGYAGRPGLRPELDRIRQEAGLDFLVMTDGSGGVIGQSVARARYLEGIVPPEVEELVSDGERLPLLRARVEIIADGAAGTIVGGQFADQELVADLAAAASAPIVITGGGRVVAGSGPVPPGIPAGASGAAELPDGGVAYVAPIAGQRAALAVVAPDGVSAGARGLVWAVLAASLILATVLGWALARIIARPLQRLAEGAMAVASGNLDTHVDAEGQGDVARLATAFNAMTENLRGYVGELEKSRDELRRGLDRLGATLRATHDLQGMLGVILDTAAVTLGARAGAVFLRSPSGRGIQLEVAHGYQAPKGASLRVGEGVAGMAAGGMSVLIPSSSANARPAGPAEPAAPTAVAVPLTRGDRSMGVLALYGRTVPGPFHPDDLETLGSFAGQASVAIENVLLHQEAQRLSITDGLTGVWNRRYLQLTLGKEIERAQRFERPLSLLMVDIDHFKDVNDTHGHQVGDEVLIEVTRRVMSVIRSQIDTLARYGGEEFVVVLPETGLSGAQVAADKILAMMRRERFAEDAGPGLSLTVSIGVASFEGGSASADELIRSADLAMYRAKQAGRDRVEVAG